MVFLVERRRAGVISRGPGIPLTCAGSEHPDQGRMANGEWCMVTGCFKKLLFSHALTAGVLRAYSNAGSELERGKWYGCRQGEISVPGYDSAEDSG